MEIDPKIDPEKLQFPSFTGQEIDEATKTFISEIMSAVPGIDEAMSFAELIQ
jgi:arsenite-transporting ATPase